VKRNTNPAPDRLPQKIGFAVKDMQQLITRMQGIEIYKLISQ
jgi:hypothetical protein